MTDLKPEAMYRLAWNANDPELRGKTVIYHKTIYHPWVKADRAVVSLLEPDGSTGRAYYVTPGSIIPHSANGRGIA